MRTIGIIVIATNAYFVLGVRFMRKFLHHYKGDKKIQFYFFSDTNPEEYTPPQFPCTWYYTRHDNWADGTNSKFRNILSTDKSPDWLFYFDADTNVTEDFDDWFLGELVGGEHYGNRSWMKERKAYDRNPRSAAYIPAETPLPQIYYYGAFFGGTTQRMMKMCSQLLDWQQQDKTWGYEPAVNDESYINKYFHIYPPQLIPSNQFKFLVSDKGGLGETRNTRLDISQMKDAIRLNRGELFEIQNNQIHFL